VQRQLIPSYLQTRLCWSINALLAVKLLGHELTVLVLLQMAGTATRAETNCRTHLQARQKDGQGKSDYQNPSMTTCKLMLALCLDTCDTSVW
jgi:alkyl hydroperoxide reductase subunit AhpF